MEKIQQTIKGDNMAKQFEDYLRENIEKGIIDFSIRVGYDKYRGIEFYIHPDGKDGETLDFQVLGNGLILKQ